MKGDQAGFTLSELAAVLAVLSLVLSGAFTAADRLLPDWRVREASASLATALRAARAQAILDRDQAVVPFDVLARRYLLAGRGAAGGAVRRTDPGGTLRRLVVLPVGVHFSRPDGGDPITLVPPGSTAPAANFGPKGLIRSTQIPGYVYLGNPRLGVYRRVGVNALGLVKVEAWDGKSWQ